MIKMFGSPNELFSIISKNTKLREGPKGVLSIILNLYRYQEKKLSNKQFSRIVEIPVPVVSAVKGELLKKNFLENKNILSTAAISWIEEKLKLRFKYDFFEDFSPYSHKLALKYQKFFQPVITALHNRPPPEYKFDQSRSTPETVVKRALIMARNGDVEGKKIVLLGDDDGLSLVLAFLNCAQEILVLDIDSRIIQYINDYAKVNKCSTILNAKFMDIRKKLPDELLNTFDIFEMDPPYTVSGFKLFVNRAISLMNIDLAFRGYISFGNKSPYEKWLCQEYLNMNNLVIDEFIPGFNSYIGATILGNVSNLYIVGSIPSKITKFESSITDEKIYTFDEKSVSKLPTVGYQIIAEFYGVKKELLTSGSLLKSLVVEGLNLSKLKTEEVFLKEYSPYGLSLIMILVESHCHLHTWPEHDYLSLDLFVCEAKEKAEEFFYFLLQRIKPIDYQRIQFYRGKPPKSFTKGESGNHE
jgi:S-adenosylmethionine decarboxylase proenzyme